MTAINELTACDAVAAIARGEFSCEALMQACLARIEAREPEVQAWVHLDPEHALAQARDADRALERGAPVGALHGLPVGIKDIIDTADMPTQHGSAMFAGNQPETDAACVSQLRDAGAIERGPQRVAQPSARALDRDAVAVGLGRSGDDDGPAGLAGGGVPQHVADAVFEHDAHCVAGHDPDRRQRSSDRRASPLHLPRPIAAAGRSRHAARFRPDRRAVPSPAQGPPGRRGDRCRRADPRRHPLAAHPARLRPSGRRAA